MAVEYQMELRGKGLDALANVLSEMPKRLPREMMIAANDLAKRHSKAIVKKVAKEIHIKQKDAKRSVTVTKRATQSSPQSQITIHKDWRPSLREFKARQTKKGVSYKISKKEKRKTIKSAFVVSRLGGHAFIRASKSRLPIIKLRGPSVWGVYVKNRMLAWSIKELEEEMEIVAARRIRAVKVSVIRKQGRYEGLSTAQINQSIKARLG